MFEPRTGSSFGRKYEGYRLNILLPASIASGFSGSGDLFEKKIQRFVDDVGAVVSTTVKAYPTAYKAELEVEIESGLNMYDIFNFYGHWMPALAGTGDLLALSDYVAAHPQRVGMDDVFQAVQQNVARHLGEIYALPTDGDAMVMIYRPDLFRQYGQDVPETWDDLRSVSQFFQDTVGSGGPGGSGACLVTKPGDRPSDTLFAFLGPFIQAHGSKQGAFFDPISMEPVFQLPIVRDALGLYREIVGGSLYHQTNSCPGCATGIGGMGLDDLIADMGRGRCALAIASLDAVKRIIATAVNVEDDSLGVVRVPGSTRVKANATTATVECGKSADNCPYASAKGVNRATYYAGGGHAWAISSQVQDSVKKQALFDLLAELVSGKEIEQAVATQDYGLNPFRTTWLGNLPRGGSTQVKDLMEQEGWKQEQLNTLKGTIEESLQDQNGVLDLKILKQQRYLDDTDAVILRFVSGNLNVDDAIVEIVGLWNDKTSLAGHTEQRNAYRASLGLPPMFDDPDCDPGQFAVRGRCEDCAAGTYKADRGSQVCTRCGAGTFASGLKATSCDSCEVRLEGSTTQSLGSTRPDDCVCGTLTYEERVSGAVPYCKRCEEGMLCDDFGLRQPRQAQGYLLSEANGTFSAFRCESKAACPASDRLNTCAPHHSGNACGSCEENYMRSKSDGCKECSGTQWPIIIAIIVACFAIGMAAHTQRNATDKQELDSVTAKVVFGQLVWALQTLGLFSGMMLNTGGGGAINFFMVVSSLVTFDWDTWKTPCAVPTGSVLSKFVLQIFGVPIVVVILLLSMGISNFVCTRQGLLVYPINKNRILNAVGQFMTMCFISIAISMLRPLNCIEHPNALQTMESEYSVICWSTDEHKVLVVLSMLAVLAYPVALLASVAYYSYRYPKMVQAGRGLEVLDSFHFLFKRFKADKYWYGFGYLLRNLLLALVPVMCPGDLASQTSVTGGLLLFSLVVECGGQPWRTKLANYMEFTVIICLCLFLQVANCILFRSGIDPGDVAQKLFAIDVAMPLVLIVVTGWVLYGHLRGRRTYGLCVIYQPMHSGMLARWVKVAAESACATHVHLSSDALDLNAAVDAVSLQTHAALVLYSKDVMKDLRCAAELSAVTKRQVKVAVVVADNHQCGAELRDWTNPWTPEEMHILAQCWIYKDDVDQALQYLDSMMQDDEFIIRFSRQSRTSEQLRSLKFACEMVFLPCQTQLVWGDAGPEAPADVIVIGSGIDPEAASISEVVALMLHQRTHKRFCVVYSEDALQRELKTAAVALLVVTRSVILDDQFAALAYRCCTGFAGLRGIPPMVVQVEPLFAHIDGKAKQSAELQIGGRAETCRAEIIQMMSVSVPFEFAPRAPQRQQEFQLNVIADSISEVAKMAPPILSCSPPILAAPSIPSLGVSAAAGPLQGSTSRGDGEFEGKGVAASYTEAEAACAPPALQVDLAADGVKNAMCRAAASAPERVVSV